MAIMAIRRFSARCPGAVPRSGRALFRAMFSRRASPAPGPLHDAACGSRVARKGFHWRAGGPGHPGHPRHPRHGSCLARSACHLRAIRLARSTFHSPANVLREAHPPHAPSWGSWVSRVSWQGPVSRSHPRLPGLREALPRAVLEVLGVLGVLARPCPAPPPAPLRPLARAFPPLHETNLRQIRDIFETTRPRKSCLMFRVAGTGCFR